MFVYLFVSLHPCLFASMLMKIDCILWQGKFEDVSICLYYSEVVIRYAYSIVPFDFDT